MFTVCPKCALTLAVTAADLRVGQGYVRCGRCASVFNALVALHEEARRDEEDPAAAADRRAATPSPPPPPLMMELPATSEPESPMEPAPDTMEFALGSADLAQIFVAPEVPEGEAASGTFESIVLEGEFPGVDTDRDADRDADADADAAIDALTRELENAEVELERIARIARDAVADPGSATQQSEVLQVTMAVSAGDRFAEHYSARADDIDAFEEPQRRWRIEAWYGVAAGILALLLVVQVVHRYRNELASSPALNGPLTSLYGALGAPLAPRWDPAALDVRQLGAIAEGDASGQLLVRASIRNEASRAQPMPLLRLTLQDRYGKRLASRDLTPREYLGERAGARDFLAAGQRVDAEVAVLDPGSNAVGFEVDACLPNGQGAVACASDSRASR